jgi:uncharacterized protein YcbX
MTAGGQEPVAGAVAALTVWPVKSMGGGSPLERVAAGRGGLAGDRAFALVDRRPLRAGKVLSARNVPGLLRWSAGRSDDPDDPEVAAPDGRRWRWSDPGLAEVVSADLGVPVGLSPPGSYSDLADSVLVTTAATHAGVEAGFGRLLDARRWRTNVHLDLDAPAFAEHGWEGRSLVVGRAPHAVVLRLLHPCRRCTIPTWSPDGAERLPELLRWFHRTSEGRFGINARVEVAGELAVGAPVEVV